MYCVLKIYNFLVKKIVPMVYFVLNITPLEVLSIKNIQLWNLQPEAKNNWSNTFFIVLTICFIRLDSDYNYQNSILCHNYENIYKHYHQHTWNVHSRLTSKPQWTMNANAVEDFLTSTYSICIQQNHYYDMIHTIQWNKFPINQLKHTIQVIIT